MYRLARVIPIGHPLQSKGAVTFTFSCPSCCSSILREGAINTLRGGGCANLASFDPKMLTPPKNGNIGLDPP